MSSYLGPKIVGKFIKLDSINSQQTGTNRSFSTTVNGQTISLYTTYQVLVVRNGSPLEPETDFTVEDGALIFTDITPAPKPNIVTTFTSITTSKPHYLIVGNTAGVTKGMRVNGPGFASNDVYVKEINSNVNVTVSGSNISTVTGNITFVDDIFIVSYGEALNIGIPSNDTVKDQAFKPRSITYNKLSDGAKDALICNIITFGI